MSFCSPLSQLLCAPSFFPHKGQDRGTRVSEGSPAPESSTLIYLHTHSKSFVFIFCIFLYWHTHCQCKPGVWQPHVSPTDPHVSLSWSTYQQSVGRRKERKQASTTWFNCLLLFTGRNLCLFCSWARVSGFVPLLEQTVQLESWNSRCKWLHTHVGKKASILMMRDEMTQYCQNKRSWGIIGCHQGLSIFLDAVFE